MPLLSRAIWQSALYLCGRAPRRTTSPAGARREAAKVWCCTGAIIKYFTSSRATHSRSRRPGRHHIPETAHAAHAHAPRLRDRGYVDSQFGELATERINGPRPAARQIACAVHCALCAVQALPSAPRSGNQVGACTSMSLAMDLRHTHTHSYTAHRPLVQSRSKRQADQRPTRRGERHQQRRARPVLRPVWRPQASVPRRGVGGWRRWCVAARASVRAGAGCGAWGQSPRSASPPSGRIDRRGPTCTLRPT
jgi:hypothetical protein